MQQQELWSKLLCMFNNSNKQICIYEGTKVHGKQEIGHMGISSDSVLGTVVLYTAGICIDNWIRIIGQKSKEHNGISQYNLDETKEECIIRKGMLIVAQDIVGGIFAINMSKFKDGIKQVWYFAPDTLEWECIILHLLHGQFKEIQKSFIIV